MLETIASLLAVPAVLYVAWIAVRRRPGQTPGEQQLEDLAREQRRTRRALDEHRYH